MITQFLPKRPMLVNPMYNSRSMTAERFPTVPDLFTVATGEQGIVEDTINTFFDEILDYLRWRQDARKHFAYRYSMELYRSSPTDTRTVPSNDRITLLVLQDITVASVLERRDDRNEVQVASACYLTPSIVEELTKDERLLRKKG